MKAISKYTTIGLFASVILGTLAGCSGTSNSSDSAASTKTEKKIVFWTHYTDDKKFTDEAVADYNAKNAGKAKVEIKYVSNDDYNNVLLLALKNNTNAPDIYADGINLSDLVNQKFAAPLDDLMSADMKQRVTPLKSINQNWLNGKFYSMPMRGYNFRLVYNKDMFKENNLDPESPPKSYQELIDTAKKLTDPSKKQYGFMLPTGENWIWWIYGNQPSHVSGKSFIDFKTLNYDFSTQKPLFDMWLQMKKDNSLYPGGTSMKNDNARATFSAGNVGMMFAASWDIGVFNDQFPAKIDWGVAPLPSETGSAEGKGEFNFGSYLLINQNSKVQQEAMDFYEYLLSPAMLKKYYEEGYGIPVYPGVLDGAAAPTKHGAAGFANTDIDSLWPPEPPVQVEGEDYGTVYNKIMNGTVTADDGLADLTKRYNAAVKKGVDNKDFNLDDYKVNDYTPAAPTGK